MLGSLGVIVAAVAIYFTDWKWIDPLVAIAIGMWVLPRTWISLRETTHILLQGVPSGFDLDAIRAAIESIPGVASTHDLHLWSVAGDDASLTVHIELVSLAVPDAVRAGVAAMLKDQFRIEHSTVQTEESPCGSEEALHL